MLGGQRATTAADVERSVFYRYATPSCSKPETEARFVWCISIVVRMAVTGQTREKIIKDLDRDNYMSSEEALNYGLIDKIVTSVDGP